MHNAFGFFVGDDVKPHEIGGTGGLPRAGDNAEDAEHGPGISAQRLAAAFFRVDYILGFLLGDDVEAHEIRGAGGLAGAGDYAQHIFRL